MSSRVTEVTLRNVKVTQKQKKKLFQTYVLVEWAGTLDFGGGGLTAGRLTGDLNDELLDWTASGMRTSGGQRMLDVLEAKPERPDGDGLNMFRGGTLNVSIEGC